MLLHDRVLSWNLSGDMYDTIDTNDMYDTNQIETIATGKYLLHSLFLSLASPPTHPGLILSPKFFFSSAAEERRDVLIGTM